MSAVVDYLEFTAQVGIWNQEKFNSTVASFRNFEPKRKVKVFKRFCGDDIGSMTFWSLHLNRNKHSMKFAQVF